MAQPVAPPDGCGVGAVIRWYRQHAGLTQQGAAVVLNTTQSRLSKIETGVLTLGIDELRFIAEKLDIPPERLGILLVGSADSTCRPERVSDSPAGFLASQERWRIVRAELNAHRAVLGGLAAELYPQAQWIPGSTALTRSDWVPTAPVEIGDIELYWVTDPARPSIIGGIAESESVRPLTAEGTRYDRYSHALRDLARPKLFDNRISYRLLDVEWNTTTGGRLGFGYTSYFETFDVCEAAAHEFTEAWLRAGRKRPRLAHLTLRRHITDPFNLAIRPALLSIATLTIRRDPIDGHRLYLHQWDAKAVASGPGLHVVPSGVFQPAGLAPAHQVNDFSLWRNIQREYSEEFLGNPEHDGNSVDAIDYEHDEPFRSFTAARRAGDFRVFAVGVALFPLELWAELLTIAVIEAPVFDQLFTGMVSVNEEGATVSTEAGKPTVGIPFTSEARERLRAEPLSPIARACLEQAWEHRHRLLGG